MAVARPANIPRHCYVWARDLAESHSAELFRIKGGSPFLDTLPSSAAGWNGRERSGNHTSVRFVHIYDDDAIRLDSHNYSFPITYRLVESELHDGEHNARFYLS